MAELKIYYSNEQDKLEVTPNLKRLINRCIKKTLDFEDFERKCEVSVTFCDNEMIRELNRDYRDKDRATDVLSFPQDEEPITDEMPYVLGDIVISLERASEQAEEFGHSFDREVGFLSIHSTLHLLGYDHELGEEEERDMRFRQTAIADLCRLKKDNT